MKKLNLINWRNNCDFTVFNPFFGIDAFTLIRKKVQKFLSDVLVTTKYIIGNRLTRNDRKTSFDGETSWKKKSWY